MITKTGIYGIRAMLALAQVPPGESVGAARIAEVVDVPQSYLSKLLQILVRDGLVRSQRGVGGGFQLARKAETISLFDIVESLERIERWNGCFLGNAVCSDQSPCAMHCRWIVVRQDYLQLLRQTNLANVAGHELLGMGLDNFLSDLNSRTDKDPDGCCGDPACEKEAFPVERTNNHRLAAGAIE